MIYHVCMQTSVYKVIYTAGQGADSVLLPVRLYMGFHSVIHSGLELDENGKKECYSKPI